MLRSAKRETDLASSIPVLRIRVCDGIDKGIDGNGSRLFQVRNAPDARPKKHDRKEDSNEAHHWSVE